MQTTNIKASVEGFKNWFFGRVPLDNHEEFDSEVFIDLPIIVQAESDLPVEGNPKATYSVAETGDTYRFIDGAYQVMDVYSYGVTGEYRDKPRRVISRNTITDPSFMMPSVSAEQIKETGQATMATLFNITALVTDLDQINRIYVHGNKTTLMEVLSHGNAPTKQENVTRWFAKNHTLLHRLLSSIMRSKTSFNKSVIDVMHTHNYILTWDDACNRPVFKVGEFTVYI